MGYAPVSDSFHSHPKVLALGPDIDALALWLLGLTWSTGHGTDGAISALDARYITARVHHHTRNRWIKALVKVGLWEEVSDGHYLYHDFLDWQKSANELRELRNARRISGYLGGKMSGQVRAEASASRTVEPTPRLFTPLLVSTQQENGKQGDMGADAPPASPTVPAAILERVQILARWPAPEALVGLWNYCAEKWHYPRVETLSIGRRTKAKALLRQFPEYGFWMGAFSSVRLSKFLMGHATIGNGHTTAFRADFDWMLAKGKDGTENAVKVHDGRYYDTGSRT